LACSRTQPSAARAKPDSGPHSDTGWPPTRANAMLEPAAAAARESTPTAGRRRPWATIHSAAASPAVATAKVSNPVTSNRLASTSEGPVISTFAGSRSRSRAGRQPSMPPLFQLAGPTNAPNPGGARTVTPVDQPSTGTPQVRMGALVGVSRMTRPVKTLARGRQPGQAATMPKPRGAGHRLLAPPNRWRWPLTLLGATQNDRSRTGATSLPEARDERRSTGRRSLLRPPSPPTASYCPPRMFRPTCPGSPGRGRPGSLPVPVALAASKRVAKCPCVNPALVD
jgi:hypothetical protein